MQASVSVQAFAQYQRLLKMLSGTEQVYQLLIATQPDEA
jgi:hypothetical protein